MIKKVVPILVIISLLLSYVHAQTISFPDMQQDHWAYNYVMALVADGTINGFDDGEFKPNNTVSRAEFVKMIGKGATKFESDFADVRTSHWGYDYIMYSGLAGYEENMFRPDVAITRFDVAQLIWQRAGAAKGVIAPAMITNQGSNRDAIAWVYAYGIMIGDNGINLRLNDTLTRAEATALIVRARSINSNSPQIDFINTVQERLLETVFNSAKLFDGIAYEPTRTITNGEMAKAAVRFGTEEYNLSYAKYSVEEPFKHPYARDLYIIGKNGIGEEKITAEFIDKNATIRDTLTALTYNAIKKSHKALSYGEKNNYYKEISSITNEMENVCLTFSYKNGVALYANGIINPDKEITLREFAAFLVQFDGLVGIHSATVIGNKTIKQNMPVQNDLNQYPANASIYQAILQGIPKAVYEVPFNNIVENKNKITGIPKQSFDFTREYGIVLTNMLTGYKNNISNTKNVKLQLTYYPSLACDNGNGYTLRLKCEVISAPDEALLKDIFAVSNLVDQNQKIYSGMVFFADFTTGQMVSDFPVPFNLVSINQIIQIVQ